jgi:glucose/arabinose dehydrogenase
VFAANGQRTVVPGGPAGPSLSLLSAPPGFCVHHFGNVPNARQVRIAPGGEVFVASPTSATTGGGPNGKAAILVLADDNHDGVADEPYPTFLASLPQTQGLLFANGFFYYQDGTRFRRLSYAPGQRQASGPGEQLVNVSAPNYVSLLHWPRSIDVADDGTLYFTNGSDQGEVCYATRPFVGGVLVIDGTPDGTPVMKGCRNPIGIRCQRGHGACYGVEMAMDYSEAQGGREKLFRVHAGDDQGYPCCATANRAYAGAVSMDSAGHPVGPPDCSQVTDEVVAFHIGRSPMGLDFEPGLWPAPWKKSVFVGLHGEFGTWTGAKVVAVATDPSTGAVRPASELAGGDASALSDFATGWDDGRRDQGRPDDVSMSADGRLFVTNDVTGEILWFAPVGLGPADGGP